MTDYRPIACSQYSELEVLALQRVRVTLVGTDEAGAEVVLTGTIVDLVTRDHAEYLVLENTAGRHSLRLDRLDEIRDGEARVLWRQKTDRSQWAD